MNWKITSGLSFKTAFFFQDEIATFWATINNLNRKQKTITKYIQQIENEFNCIH